MSRIAVVRPVPLFLAAVGIASAGANAQSFRGLPVLPGHGFADAYAVNRDGSVIVGTSGVDFLVDSRAVRWTANGCVQDLGLLPNATDMLAVSVSRDGNAIAGFGFYPNYDFAFRWTAAGGLQDLGRLPGAVYGASANAISGDGRVVVGQSHTPGDFHAFRWVEGQGMSDLGVLPGGSYSYAMGASHNGNVVVGFGNSATWEDAFRWTPAGGMQPLARLDPEFAGAAFAVSANGAFATGYSGPAAVRWLPNGQVQDLGLLPGGTFAVGYAISGDGKLIGGAAEDELGHFVATIWTPWLGLVDVRDLLDWLDIDWSGWQPMVIAGVSADGGTLVGFGPYFGEERPFVIDLPCSRNGWHGSMHGHH